MINMSDWRQSCNGIRGRHGGLPLLPTFKKICFNLPKIKKLQFFLSQTQILQEIAIYISRSNLSVNNQF